MIFILNILWFVLGGFIAGLAWILAGIIMAITIVGLPFVPTCFRLARYTFWPFGYDIVSRDQLTGQSDIGTGAIGTIGNIIWFVFAGWWLALMHISAAIALTISINWHSVRMGACEACDCVIVPGWQTRCRR